MIVAIDPGGTTGIAYRITAESPKTLIQFDEAGLYDWLEAYHQNLSQVIIENFVTGGFISKDGLYTVRLVGGVQALCHLWGIPCDTRNSNTRSTFIPQAKEILKKQKPNHVIHEVDALSHLLQWEYLKSHNRTNPLDAIRKKVNDVTRPI